MSTYTTPVPGSVGAAQTALLAKTAYQQALAQINQRRQGTLREYGYNAQIDPNTGVVGSVSVDPNNPYGHLQETLGMNADEAQAGEDALSERGIRGGLAKQQEGRMQHLFGRRKSQLGTSLLGALGGLQQEQSQAKYGMDAALYQAQLEAARNAIGNNEFNPANLDNPPGSSRHVDYTDAGGTDPGDTGGPVRTGYGGQPGSGNPPKANWGGSWKTRDQVVRQLMARGVKPSAWAKKHPAAAKKLGISPKLNANNKIISKAMKGRG